jgi:hypothetical protein
MLHTTNWELSRRWKRQIGTRKLLPSRRPRHAAGVGFLCQGWQPQSFVELSRLLVVAVYDIKTTDGVSKVRVAGYRPQITPEGVDWLGAKSAVFWKDLLLRPKPFAKGQRIDTRSALLKLALRLEHRVEQGERHPRRVDGTMLRFPRLWAGFRRSVFHAVEASGPEIKALSDKFGLPLRSMAAKFVREHDGLTLLPASWVNEDLHRATTMFAETTMLAYRQAVPLSQFANGIIPGLAWHRSQMPSLLRH